MIASVIVVVSAIHCDCYIEAAVFVITIVLLIAAVFVIVIVILIATIPFRSARVDIRFKPSAFIM